MSEDKLLLTLLKKGSRDAFNALFEKYSPKLYFFCLKSFQNKVDAEEIVQDAFMKIWETRSRIDENQHFNTYLIAIAKHIIYDFLKHKVVERKYSDYILQSSDGSYNIEQEVALKDFKQYMLGSIEQLPAQQKEILLLKSKGYDNDEIAQQLNLSKRTIETHINRAFKFLRIYLAAKKEVYISLIFIALTKFLS